MIVESLCGFQLKPRSRVTQNLKNFHKNNVLSVGPPFASVHGGCGYFDIGDDDHRQSTVNREKR